jgi:hypothetical protein
MANETAWWVNLQLDPRPIANQFWQASPIHLTPNGLHLKGSWELKGLHYACLLPQPHAQPGTPCLLPTELEALARPPLHP